MVAIRGVNEATKRLIDFAEQLGWKVSRTRDDHLRFEKEGRQTVFTSSTTSDRRAALNAKSQLRRADAGHGVSR